MSNSDPQNEVTKIMSKIMEEQLKSSDTNSSEFQILLEEHKKEEVFKTSILPIFKVLKTLQKEKVINTEEFNARITPLMNILQLLHELPIKTNK